MITSDATDAKSNLYPYGENKIYYQFDNSLKLVSLENGDPVDSTNQVTANYRKMFMGKTMALVQSKENSATESAVIAAILGDKKLFSSKFISIFTEDLLLGAKASKSKLDVYYTTNGDDPATKGISYQKAFEITDGTTVKAIVKQNGKVILYMSEKFGESEGLFWGDENTKDLWKNRGITFQAEDATLNGAIKLTEGKRFKGKGFVTFNDSEGSVKWYQENDGSEGIFDLVFKYSSGDQNNNRPMILLVNDKVIDAINFPSTGSWNADWKPTLTVKVWFKTGSNYIELRTKGESGPNLDELIVE
jgi:beta-galactosidase